MSFARSNRDIARNLDFRTKLQAAIDETMADYTECNLLETMHDILIDLDKRGLLSVPALIDALAQWVEEQQEQQ